MRDLLNLLDNVLTEASNLAANELNKYEWRWEKFINKITSGEPFETVDGQQVVLDPKQLTGLINLKKQGKFAKGITVSTIGPDGKEGPRIPISSLKKTAEFAKPGGEAVPTGQQRTSKETALVKPSLINITDRNIPAEDLYNEIANNPVLKSTEYGRVVIQLAQYIVSGEIAMLPEEYQSKDNEQMRKAIVDYAGEYLGVLALLYRQSRFPERAEFEKWLGSSTDDLVINFPSKANTNIADSYATVTNPDTNHTLNISSKGTGGGAAPAISGLKIPDDIKRNPKLKTALQFIEICQRSDKSGGPSTITQAFAAMDLLYDTNPDSIPKVWQKYLPFAQKSPDLMPLCVQQIKNKDMRPLPKKYAPLTTLVDSAKATEGGKIVYSIKKAVQDAINNNNAIPEFRSTILEVLNMNFIQQYTDYNNGALTFVTQWPAKISGDISVENKSSAISPTDGGFSFKLGRPADVPADTDLGAPGVEDNPPEYGGDEDKLDAFTQGRLKGPGVKAARDTTEPKLDVSTLGREKRRR